MSATFEDFVTTADGTITMRHPGYDETFHSTKGARFEADSLYMKASGFRKQLQGKTSEETTCVLDVGLGLGYNALMTIECWMQSPGAGDLILVSLEHTPELVQSLADPTCAWKKGWPSDWQDWSRTLAPVEKNWQAELNHPVSARKLSWIVLVGDAQLADLRPFSFDYIWQDAFSPKKNAELWSIAWFEKLRAVSQPHVQLVTYSVARMVRDHLEAAAWTQERVKAPEAEAGEEITKKQWLRARLSTT